MKSNKEKPELKDQDKKKSKQVPLVDRWMQDDDSEIIIYEKIKAEKINN